MNLSNTTILVVEDDYLSWKLIEKILQPTNAQLLFVQNGNDALQYFNDDTHKINIILLDIQLPGINGYEVAKEIRKIDKKIIIIAQTAYALTGDKEKALKAGCNDYITKPIKKDMLFTVLKKNIG